MLGICMHWYVLFNDDFQLIVWLEILRDKKFAVFMDFEQTSKISSSILFILGNIYVCNINWNELWLICCFVIYRNYVSSIINGSLMALLKLDPGKKGLSNPSGPLSTIIPALSIAASALHAFIAYWTRFLSLSISLLFISKQSWQGISRPLWKVSRISSYACNSASKHPFSAKKMSKSMIFFMACGLHLFHADTLPQQTYPLDYSIPTCREVLLLLYSSSDTHVPLILLHTCLNTVSYFHMNDKHVNCDCGSALYFFAK